MTHYNITISTLNPLDELSDLLPSTLDYGSVNGLGFIDLDYPVKVKDGGMTIYATSVYCDGYTVVVADEDGNQYEVTDKKAISYIVKNINKHLKYIRKYMSVMEC